jgi:hypothetical protein
MASIKPYLPIPFRAGNKLIKKYTEPYTARGGYRANVTYADYIDKKGLTVIGSILYISWVDL